MSEYISDRELGPVERSSEVINENVWNAFVSIFDNLVLNNSLSISFPESCPDGQGICGCNTQQLEDAIKAEIPKLPVPIRCSRTNYNAGNLQVDKYAVLDFLEFLAKNIKDVSVTGRFHDFFNHYHYCQNHSKNNVNEYLDKVNTIFARNGVVFYLDSDGLIKRTIPHSLNRIITGIRFSTNDDRLNELLEISYSKFILPRAEDRIQSLEKIWDAFERLKTYFEENKRNSALTLISHVSNNNQLFQSGIESEFRELTKIGNEFQIRHFERDKVQLHSNLHIDYLFYRMSSLMHLCLESLRNA